MTDYENVAFPLDSFKEAAIHLRRPFTPQAVKWKVQSNFGEKGCLVVGHIDARLVVERLNKLVPHLWFDRYTPVDGNTVRCELTVDGITRIDVGVGRGPEAAKAGYSDALKRAAVKFGIGVSLYAIPQARLWLNKHGDYIKLGKTKDGKPTFTLTGDGMAALASRYDKWLTVHGEESFGPSLDHGDVEGSVGDPDVLTEDAAKSDDDRDPPAGPLIEGEVADELRRRCRDTYAAITDLEGRAKFPAGAFQAGLESAGGSVEGLEGYLAELQARLEKNRQPVAS